MGNNAIGSIGDRMKKNAMDMFRCIGIFLALAAAVCLEWSNASAEYRDLIDMPALKMDAAPSSLLLDITQAGDRLVAVGERGHIVLSDDQGKTWTQAEVDTRAHLNAVFFVDPQHGWAVGEDAVILHSEDGGNRWHRQYDARNADMQGPLLDLWFKNIDEGFAVGVFNKIYRTTDGGKNWQDWYDHVDNIDEWHLFAIAAATPEVIYIASEKGLLFQSVDGGENFTPLQTPHDGTFHGILVDRGPDGLDRILLSGVGGVVFVSRDSGLTWQKLETGTEAGLAGGTWLDDGSAVIVGHDGMVLRIDPHLERVKRFPQENGLPLSTGIVSAAGELILVGVGGVQKITVPQGTN
jgi:photosystem II stability/assembly factor-like uncharacterized protein